MSKVPRRRVIGGGGWSGKELTGCGELIVKNPPRARLGTMLEGGNW
jgi:hypothetical protein